MKRKNHPYIITLLIKCYNFPCSLQVQIYIWNHCIEQFFSLNIIITSSHATTYIVFIIITLVAP